MDIDDDEEESPKFRYVFTVEATREGPVTDWLVDVSEFDGIKNARQLNELIAVHERLEPGSGERIMNKSHVLKMLDMRSRHTAFGGVYAVSSSTELTREALDKIMYEKFIFGKLDDWLEGARGCDDGIRAHGRDHQREPLN